MSTTHVPIRALYVAALGAVISAVAVAVVWFTLDATTVGRRLVIEAIMLAGG